jgi:hypothetical protein
MALKSSNLSSTLSSCRYWAIYPLKYEKQIKNALPPQRYVENVIFDTTEMRISPISKIILPMKFIKFLICTENFRSL